MFFPINVIIQEVDGTAIGKSCMYSEHEIMVRHMSAQDKILIRMFAKNSK